MESFCGHLDLATERVDIATNLTEFRFAQSCGLVMAISTSLNAIGKVQVHVQGLSVQALFCGLRAPPPKVGVIRYKPPPGYFQIILYHIQHVAPCGLSCALPRAAKSS